MMIKDSGDLAVETIFLSKKRSKVLLVEDNPSDAEMAREELRLWDCEVVTVSTGAAALDAASFAELDHNQFDVAVIDILLPGMTGIDLATRLHKQYETIVIIMCSGAAKDSSIVIEALELGFIIVPKPFSVTQVRALAKSLSIIQPQRAL